MSASRRDLRGSAEPQAARKVNFSVPYDFLENSGVALEALNIAVKACRVKSNTSEKKSREPWP